MNKKILLYGANGFTAGLMLENIKALPAEIILAGRNHDVIAALADCHGFSFRTFDLEHAPIVATNLNDIGLVLNCAGPFSKTAVPLARAAVKSKAHYFDITGELDVFTDLYELDDEARAQNVSIIPGMGFDIVPSDCLSKMLAERMNTPKSLVLAVVARNTRPSHGTLKTAFLEIGFAPILRSPKGIVRAPKAEKSKLVTIKGRSISCIRAPLADLFCAHLSTGITTIDTYLAMPKPFMLVAPLLGVLNSVGKRPLVNKMIATLIERLPNGPSVTQQQRGHAYIFGEVTGGKRKMLRGVLKTPEPYRYTADAMIEGAKRWLKDGLKPGFQTPSLAFGADFALTVGQGCEVEFFDGAS